MSDFINVAPVQVCRVPGGYVDFTRKQSVMGEPPKNVEEVSCPCGSKLDQDSHAVRAGAVRTGNDPREKVDCDGMKQLIDWINAGGAKIVDDNMFVGYGGWAVATLKEIPDTGHYDHAVYDIANKYIGYIRFLVGTHYYNVNDREIGWDRPKGYEDKRPNIREVGIEPAEAQGPLPAESEEPVPASDAEIKAFVNKMTGELSWFWSSGPSIEYDSLRKEVLIKDSNGEMIAKGNLTKEWGATMKWYELYDKNEKLLGDLHYEYSGTYFVESNPYTSTRISNDAAYCEECFSLTSLTSWF